MTHSRLRRSRSSYVTSHDNRDNILSDQKLHDLLKAEDKMDRLERAKLGPRDEPVVSAEKGAQEPCL
ncbi:hypothetical protein CCGE531_10295 [Rhizobium sp. CCGE531]|nr:hypothetical protein CCGE531_10295 [Rhizobium sp. CCGE531]AYG72723.1 hypothetical protein CCGE532_09720 [Rhizobium sp. CCGE532]